MTSIRRAILRWLRPALGPGSAALKRSKLHARPTRRDCTARIGANLDSEAADAVQVSGVPAL